MFATSFIFHFLQEVSPKEYGISSLSCSPVLSVPCAKARPHLLSEGAKTHFSHFEEIKKNVPIVSRKKCEYLWKRCSDFFPSTEVQFIVDETGALSSFSRNFVKNREDRDDNDYTFGYDKNISDG